MSENNSILKRMQEPMAERVLMRKEENPEVLERKLGEALKKVQKAIENGEINKERGIGQVAFEFMGYVHSQEMVVGGSQIGEIFDQFNGGKDTAYQKEVVIFIASQFERMQAVN